MHQLPRQIALREAELRRRAAEEGHEAQENTEDHTLRQLRQSSGILEAAIETLKDEDSGGRNTLDFLGIKITRRALLAMGSYFVVGIGTLLAQIMLVTKQYLDDNDESVGG